jgi:hypothetical protein
MASRMNECREGDEERIGDATMRSKFQVEIDGSASSGTGTLNHVISSKVYGLGKRSDWGGCEAVLRLGHGVRVFPVGAAKLGLRRGCGVHSWGRSRGSKTFSRNKFNLPYAHLMH